jgi:protein-S-isoprenylcysteine O-methyltransferase Ste14
VHSGHQDNPGVIAPPLLIYGIPLVLGVYANRRYPFEVGRGAVMGGVGIALAVFAIVLGFWAVVQFWRAHTSMMPYRPTTVLIETGPFRYSRNPLYVAMAAGYVGVALLANTIWPLFLLPLVLLMMHRGVVEREERYLERKFGDKYIDYRSRVRRWL